MAPTPSPCGETPRRCSASALSVSEVCHAGVQKPSSGGDPVPPAGSQACACAAMYLLLCFPRSQPRTAAYCFTRYRVPDVLWGRLWGCGDKPTLPVFWPWPEPGWGFQAPPMSRDESWLRTVGEVRGKRRGGWARGRGAGGSSNLSPPGRSLARRVQLEANTRGGQVAYQIRGQDHVETDCQLVYCTTGICAATINGH